MSQRPIARRQLNDAQWLQAMGIDPFWIEGATDEQVGSAVKPAPTALVPAAAPGTATSAVLSGDWAALEESIRACRACGLCKGRKQAVPGSGDRQATWLLVGEAPGAEEDAAGLPFVGKAGKLLDAMLAALNLKRENGVYIANAVKCRPPENRTPESTEIDACVHFLKQQIALIRPEVIVALGRPAAYAVLDNDATIQSLRGKIHHHTQGDLRIPVVVTYHPAYLLRQPEEKWKSWQDLLLAASALGNTATAH